jgi:hypothetical protein
MLFRWLAAVARVERTGARPSSAVVLRRHRRVDYCLHGSTDFGMCPEREKNSLVTMAAIFYLPSRTEVIAEVAGLFSLNLGARNQLSRS